jgi:hypothetical protein
MAFPQIPGRTFERLKRCENCKHFRTGLEVMEDVCKEKGLINPLSFRLVQPAPGVPLNPGIVDELLLQTVRGKAGRCQIGASESVLTSAGAVCEKHQGISGLEHEGKANDPSVEEIKALRNFD